MDIDAALMTGKGTGAISTIQIVGKGARSLLRKLFKPVGTRPAKFTMGEILLGTICDGAEVIDQVTLGCEGPDNFAIHCHGNPLIVEMIMELLRKHGASLVTVEQLLARTLAVQESSNTIAIEARLAQANTKTIEGARIVANQVDAGLAGAAQDRLDGMDGMSLDEIKAEAVRILRNSKPARLIMYGCTAVMTGPPNSGKSTLLNYLAGRQKAIVTDIKGTTRDWVEAEFRIGPLSVTLIDTAGLDAELSDSQPQDSRLGLAPPADDGGASPTLHDPELEPASSGSRPGIDQAVRQKTTEILEQADLVLLVLDGSRPAHHLDEELLGRISNKRVITILNKSDLPTQFDPGRLPEFLSEPVRISARDGAGIEELAQSMRRISGVDGFDLHQPVCFTGRQEDLLRQLTTVGSGQRAGEIIRELLSGQLVV